MASRSVSQQAPYTFSKEGDGYGHMEAGLGTLNLVGRYFLILIRLTRCALFYPKTMKFGTLIKKTKKHFKKDFIFSA